MLPEPSWPDEPGSAGVLEPLRRFCNTTNRENGAEAWRTGRELNAWLVREGYRQGRRRRSRPAHRGYSDALWRGVCTNDFGELARTAGVLSVDVAGTSGRVALRPARSGVDDVIARIVLTVVAAASDR